MKNLKILALNILTSVAVYAQTYTPFSYSPKFNGSGIFTGSLSVGQNSGPNPSAAFEVYSTNKGFLMPRLSTLQRNSINYPSIGLQIYNTTTSAINYYNGSSWIAVGTGAGTVTSVAATVPSVFSVSGSPITTSGTLAITYSGTPLPVVNGGIGLNSYTVGDLIYASGATTLSKLADVATGNALISGGVGTAPSWGKIGLTTHITGGNWKTIYTNGSGVVTELALGSSGQVLQSNGASSAPTWVTPSSGITVGTTTITSGTTLRIPYNLGGVYQEQVNFTIGSVATGYLDVPTGYAIGGFNFAKQTYNAGVLEQMAIGYLAGVNMDAVYYGTGGSLYIGIKAGRYSAGQYTSNNTVVGNNAFSHASLYGSNNGNNTLIGYSAASGWTGGCDNNTVVGTNIGTAAGSAIRQSTYVGAAITTVYTNSGAFGYGAQPTAANQLVIGNGAAAAGTGVFDNVYFNGVTFTSPAPIVLNAAGGSGSNVSGASFTISGGKGTGTGTGGSFVVKTSTTLGTGTTLQSLVSRLTISGGAVTTDASTATWADALDFVFSGTTGTKIGTATTQKIGFWNATPIVQPTTAITAAAFVSNTSLIADDSATFGGYTIGQIVAALKSAGLLQ